MDLTEIKSENGQKGNRIVLRGLTKRQKELMVSSGVVASGIGMGAGLFSLYSMDEPDQIPQNELFLSSEEKDQSRSEEIALFTDKHVTSNFEDGTSFAEAFKIARNEVGAGGWFIHNEKVYNTYYKEEWENLSTEDRQEYLASIKMEPISVENEFKSEPELTITEIPVDGEQTEESIMEPALNIVTDSLKENVSVYPPSEMNAEGSDSDLSVSFISEIGEQASDEFPESQLETFIPEENRNYEVSIEEQDELDFTFIDASDEIVFGDDVIQVFESITPIPIYNLEDNLDLGLEVDLLTEHANDHLNSVADYQLDKSVDPITNNNSESVDDQPTETNEEPVIVATGITGNVIEEYPWGEPVIDSSSARHEVIQDNIEIVVENPVIIDAELISNEVEEYPWGEPVNKNEHIQNTENIKIGTGENQNSILVNEIHPTLDAIEEYPWGEPIIGSSSARHEDTQDNIEIVVENPVILEAELNSDNIEEYPWGEPMNKSEHISNSENIKIVTDEDQNSILVQEIHPTLDAIEEYPWGEPMENVTDQQSEEANNLFSENNLHD